jgi:hypothetical protein
MATQGSVQSNAVAPKYAVWKVDWTSKKIAPGRTQVDWVLSFPPRNTGTGYLTTKGLLQVNNEIVFTTTPEGVSGRDVYYNGTNQYYDNGYQTFSLEDRSGSIVVEHNSSGAGSFTIKFDI